MLTLLFAINGRVFYSYGSYGAILVCCVALRESSKKKARPISGQAFLFP